MQGFMRDKHIQMIARELLISDNRVKATLSLLAEGGTVPFIARYRKELTGGLDETVIRKIRDRNAQLQQIASRKESILKSLTERKLLTHALKKKIEACFSPSELEDLYLPYRPKRRTRATVAREKGLEPLAKLLFSQEIGLEPELEASAFLNTHKGVHNEEEALAGARDIIAEWINENPQMRKKMRRLFLTKSIVHSKVVKGKREEGIKYSDYFDWNEPIDKMPAHRLLAMRRGEKELILSLSIAPPAEEAIRLLEYQFLKRNGGGSNHIQKAIQDSYKRLLKPSMENELRSHTKKTADEVAIKVFAENLSQLLLAPPLGPKRVMALDPGFRTGCKLVCLNEQGKLLHFETIYPNPPQERVKSAASTIRKLVKQYQIEAIAVGNGTAGRETEAFLQTLGLDRSITIVMVDESGASIYSASDAARDEFPELDLTIRGAISIGRRLIDPLAELVKLDPKSIGVGQYQHDVDQKLLKGSLDDVVVSCVNSVGVEVNRASKELLTYVSGLGEVLAKNIIQYRNSNGPFNSRKQLLKVSRLGPKAFEQAAGFLRISDAKNPLDRTAVHPESYHIVKKMSQDLSLSLSELIDDTNQQKRINIEAYINGTIGLPTLQDIMKELAKPGRDPRDRFEPFSFAEGINTMEDLRVGMWLPGIVTNITDFGAFVDIGVHQSGLVHISQLADKYVKHPADVVKVHERVRVRVVEVDLRRKRIALSMRPESPE